MGLPLPMLPTVLVKLLHRQQDELTRFRARAAAVRHIGVQLAIAGRWLMLLYGLGAAVGTALGFGAGGYFAIRGNMTTGELVTFTIYLVRLYGPVTALFHAQLTLQLCS